MNGVWGWSLLGGGGPSAEPPRFSLVPKEAFKDGKGQIEVLQSSALQESFLDRMLGTNCYTQAVQHLERDCKTMDQEDKSRLALRLVNCQLATQGQSTFPCSEEEHLRKCMDRLSERAYSLYVEFLTHSDSMCLFIQNREFEKYTETLLNQLSVGAGFAKEQFLSLSQQATSLVDTAKTITGNTEEALRKLQEQRTLQLNNLDALKQHSAETFALHDDLTAKQQQSIDLSKQALEQQDALQQAQLDLIAALASGKTMLENALTAASQRSEQLVEAQSQAAVAQAHLGQQLMALADGSQGLRSAVDAVVVYQQRSDAALVRLLGRSYSLEDAAFYGSGVLLALAAGATQATQSARFPMLALLAVSLLSERMLVDQLHLWLEINPMGDVVLSLPVPIWMAFLGIEPGSLLLEFNFKWAVRKTCMALGASALFFAAVLYRDYGKLTSRKLDVLQDKQKLNHDEYMQRQSEIKQQIIELKCLYLASAGGEEPRRGQRETQRQYFENAYPLQLAQVQELAIYEDVAAPSTTQQRRAGRPSSSSRQTQAGARDPPGRVTGRTSRRNNSLQLPAPVVAEQALGLNQAGPSGVALAVENQVPQVPAPHISSAMEVDPQIFADQEQTPAPVNVKARGKGRKLSTVQEDSKTASRVTSTAAEDAAGGGEVSTKPRRGNRKRSIEDTSTEPEKKRRARS